MLSKSRYLLPLLAIAWLLGLFQTSTANAVEVNTISGSTNQNWKLVTAE